MAILRGHKFEKGERVNITSRLGTVMEVRIVTPLGDPGLAPDGSLDFAYIVEFTDLPGWQEMVTERDLTVAPRTPEEKSEIAHEIIIRFLASTPEREQAIARANQ